MQIKAIPLYVVSFFRGNHCSIVGVVHYFLKYIFIDSRERERDREWNINVRNIDQLPPICTQTRD